MNFDKVENITNSMVQNGLTRHQAVGLALALEFAANHPEFATRFGEFMQVGLRSTLDEIVSHPPV